MSGHKGFTLWMTGLSGSGKSTITDVLIDEFEDRGVPLEVLDGDVVRENLSKGLGFSKEDRDINIRRIGFVCNLLSRNDVVAIAAAISPYTAIREENRNLIGRYVEIFCRCSLDALVERDVKGLYKKALAGEIKGFTGVDDPYEAPENAEIVVDSDKETIEQSVAKIIRSLELMEYIPVAESDYKVAAEDEEQIRTRLRALNFSV